MMRLSRRSLMQAPKTTVLFSGTTFESPLDLSGLSPNRCQQKRRMLLLRCQKRTMRSAPIEKVNAEVEFDAAAQPANESKKTTQAQDDVLARYPNTTPAGILRGMDYMGTALFASTGCITAGLAGMDVVGCTLVGTITACGGGTVRDVLLGNTPVFWFQEPEYLYLAAGCAFLTFCVWHMVGEDVEHRLTTERCVFWMDSLGLGAFACIGVQNAVRAGLGFLPSVVCGLMTATFGGVIRDTLCRRPARILHANDETYAAAPIASSVAYLAARAAKATLAQRIVCGVITSLVIRAYAVAHDYKLPRIHYVKERTAVRGVTAS